MVKLQVAKYQTGQDNIKTTLRPVIILGQLLGIFPNFQGKGITKKCLLVLYSLFSGLGTFCLMFYYIFLKEEHDRNKNSKVHSLHLAQLIFLYASISCSFLLYFRLSINWPSLVERWSKIDAALFCDNLYGYPWYLKRLCLAIILYSWALPTGQYFVVHYMHYTKLRSMPQNNGSVSIIDISQSLYPHLRRVHAVLWYPLGVCLHVYIVLHGNLLNGFIEGFIMVVSVNLASRLRQLTNFARTRNTWVPPNHRLIFWTNIRKDYCRLSNLISCVDDQICLVTFCTYTRVLTFLLNVLTSFLENMDTPGYELYCIYSGFHHFAKLISLTIFSAWVNEESTRIVRVINSNPSEDYSNEERRLFLQISFDEVAMTGNRMFKIKKNLILKVINAVVTYELIIIQYKKS